MEIQGKALLSPDPFRQGASPLGTHIFTGWVRTNQQLIVNLLVPLEIGQNVNCPVNKYKNVLK